MILEPDHGYKKVYPDVPMIGLVKSSDKLKLCLHYHNAYGHKTWQDDDLPNVTSNLKVT